VTGRQWTAPANRRVIDLLESMANQGIPLTAEINGYDDGSLEIYWFESEPE
jgi:hypothetical protein